MEFKLIWENEDKSEQSFLFKGVNAGFVNALRRAVIERVPVMAIEEVVFKKNDSILYDDILAHRLGLIPLVTDLKSYVLPEDCVCGGEGCAQCTLKVRLSKEGPCTVYSGDLKFDDPAIKPVYDKIPIVKLLEGQALEFEATAILGRGKEHVKWSPAHVYYRNVANIKIGKVKNPEKVISVCPRKVFSNKSGKLEVMDAQKCNLCGACSDVEDIRVEPKNDEFVFTIESWKQLSVKEILLRAIKELDQLLDDFKKNL